MKKYISYPRADVEIHGGGFIPHAYKIILEISSNNLVQFKVVDVDNIKNIQQIYTGVVTENGHMKKIEVSLKTDVGTLHTKTITAKVEGNQIYCLIHSEPAGKWESEILVRFDE